MRWLEVHKFLNEMWEGIITAREKVQRLLEGTGFTVGEIEEVFGSYIYIDGRWERMNYPYPAFEIKPGGEVGVTPQGPYFVFAIPVEILTESLLEEFIKSFEKAFIYGYNNFLRDFYSPAQKKENILKDIKRSGEPAVQLEAEFDSWEGLFKGLPHMIKILKREGVELST